MDLVSRHGVYQCANLGIYVSAKSRPERLPRSIEDLLTSRHLAGVLPSDLGYYQC